ncbi:oxidoreductase [Wenjunlia vitaminophila]|uniref:Oxidoreductase n=1 Tax=Wenjunlia vitaminophila TaxID=76728 RepID=A0A0T6LZQ3_WENVI|nr:aldo/keto reductase [Wenjunlia vitaminophila]KRV51228.1 oxidoreductase [Wenjunlia vitaminophila]
MSTVPHIDLNNGVRMPQLGFGVWRIPQDRTTEAVRAALDAGYRSVDTAAVYENEEGTGRALVGSGLPREELFVTTKVWNSEQGFDATLRAFDASLERLGLEYVDLYLIHWPAPAKDLYVETWTALERIHAEGRAKAIGVSNFQVPHLRRLIGETSVVPAVNQVELHPWLQQRELREFHAEHGIATEAWGPLGRGGDLLREPTLVRIAERHGRSVAQVMLRWHLQLGNIAIPKSVTPSRIRENIDVFDFTLDDEDLAAVAELDSGQRLGPDPDTMA